MIYSTVRKSNCISVFKCKNRPGVAIITSGLAIMAPNWSSIESPPISSNDRRSDPRLNSLNCLDVCIANSRDGERIIARTPILATWVLSFSIRGNKNAAVLPEPVLAIPTTSLFDIINGIVLRWIGVGCLYPFLLKLVKMCFERPKDANVPFLAFFAAGWFKKKSPLSLSSSSESSRLGNPFVSTFCLFDGTSSVSLSMISSWISPSLSYPLSLSTSSSTSLLAISNSSSDMATNV
ncbi:hypothetical protein OGAPHI_007133 [Ogataea philodendri]|uniref:Uncharacterized protein n=1 Tax=Ogataea philodendri TaxID=1378263 RepID=A0A9P8NW50_9ASCO|nr:uncharacterized protein OGAPHI_007133 [Ogataea philodendri]KAH3660547.1 hypothetical protein OGAPHI_007133 [Ogataea philodendri]